MGNTISRVVKALLDCVEVWIPEKYEKLRPAIQSLKKGLIPLIAAVLAQLAKKISNSPAIRGILVWVSIAGLLLFLGIIAYRGWSPDSPGQNRHPDQPVAVDSSRHDDHGYDTCKDAPSCEVPLPDGSTAIISNNSSIRYTPDFEGERREVYLNGNAVFQVVANAGKPFIVHVGYITVQVLGTVFNLMTDSSEHRFELTVITGAVQVTAGANKRRVDSAWQAVVEGGVITMNKPDSPTSCLHWTEKIPYFDFHETKLAIVAGRLARLHHVTVYNPDHVCGIPITGIFLFNARIEDDVEALQCKEKWYAVVFLRNDTIYIRPLK